ncbi:hypothetical protein B7R54_15835 [Subtercola boreus]|uniref:Short-chain dehydrogenase n=1 Tax=Subtercola boreus TaxID=120213 RepID=A0A3E0VLJ3_9MICO|nr:hypothetical protein B7R54_15835 [Subtercola boreus]TQL55954.1 short subunit dehydrogenase [Subtercola boreus]
MPGCADGDNGANVVVSGRRAEALAETVGGFPDARTLVVPADISSRADVDAVVTAAVERFGALDVLVANAGVYFGGEIDELTDPQWATLKATNIDGVVFSVSTRWQPPLHRVGSLGPEIADLGPKLPTRWGGGRSLLQPRWTATGCSFCGSRSLFEPRMKITAMTDAATIAMAAAMNTAE